SGVLTRDDRHVVPRARERAREQPAYATRPEDRDPLHGSISTPGLSSPAGSTAALAARSASANGSGRWRSYHGRWSRPTAWWWVIVPPAASTASETARLTASHCAASSPRRAGASTVK